MRNKDKFINDAYAVMKSEYKEDINVVEDAAHVMNQTNDTKYTLPKMFTNTGKDEVFKFDKKMRQDTDDPNIEIEDFFYLEKED